MYRPTITTADPPIPPKGGSSADKESITMSIEVINGMADTIAELERKIDFIYEQLAKDFDIPCNFSPIDEIMFNSGRCEQDCREIKPDSECWRRYFEEMQRRSEQ